MNWCCWPALEPSNIHKRTGCRCFAATCFRSAEIHFTSQLYTCWQKQKDADCQRLKLCSLSLKQSAVSPPVLFLLISPLPPFSSPLFFSCPYHLFFSSTGRSVSSRVGDLLTHCSTWIWRPRAPLFTKKSGKSTNVAGEQQWRCNF